jgi:FKBP-type peptidyl-prolyl cis-trans isomerase SlyD
MRLGFGPELNGETAEMAEIVKKDKVVKVSFVLKDRSGAVIDSSSEDQPLEYLHGHGNIIPGLEEELSGKTVGSKLTAVIPPEDAYGVRDEDLVETVPREHFPPDQQITVGMQFAADTPDGEVRVTVADVTEDTVTVDKNHPLAGVELHFDVTVLGIRSALKEEIAHGHAHGEFGHQHS